jgi:peptidoglycan-associated lipoprotein
MQLNLKALGLTMLDFNVSNLKAKSFKKLLPVLLLAFSVLIAGCTCKPRQKPASSDASMGGAETIPVAGDGGPLKDIYFAFDSSALSSTSKSILGQNAQYLKDHQGATVVVEGHCDERGTTEYNMALGARRAESAMKYLEGLGVASSRMSTISYGEELPLDPSHNEEAWAKNRRVHFSVKE